MNNIPYGFCHCGCGRKTKIAKRNIKEYGYKKGEPINFIHGHHVNLIRQFMVRAKGENHHNWKGGIKIGRRGCVRILMRNHPRANSEGYVLEHILIAEKVLKKPLPKGVVIHHIDGNPANNSNANLVICQNDVYHHYLHYRQRKLCK